MAQLAESIREQGLQAITYRQLDDYLRIGVCPPENAIIVSLDDFRLDRLDDDMVQMVAEFESRGLSLVLGVITGHEPSSSVVDWYKAIDKLGSEIASHSVSHRNFPELGWATVETEVQQSYETLCVLMERCPTTLILPYGNNDQRSALRNAAFDRYRFLVGIAGGRTIDMLDAPWYVGRMGVYLESPEYMLTMLRRSFPLRPTIPQSPVIRPPSDWEIENVMRWLPLVQQWHADFPELDPAWVLAVIAQESQGDPKAEAGDRWGSVGLMQIAPRRWLATREQLLNPALNISTGMHMLSQVLEQTGDIRHTLAGYNCGLKRLEREECGASGGWAYADRVLDYWTPIFRAELFVDAGRDDAIGDWLATLGYAEGLGDWQEVTEEEVEEICRELPARRFRPRLCV